SDRSYFAFYRKTTAPSGILTLGKCRNTRHGTAGPRQYSRRGCVGLWPRYLSQIAGSRRSHVWLSHDCGRTTVVDRHMGGLQKSAGYGPRDWVYLRQYTMILSRAPYRISLGGGGTDLPSYYQGYGGFILSAAINKYLYIYANRPAADEFIRLKYSMYEQ